MKDEKAIRIGWNFAVAAPRPLHYIDAGANADTKGDDMGSWEIGRINAALPFKQTGGECEPVFDVDRHSDYITVSSSCHAGAATYEEGDLFERASHTIPIEEFQKLHRTVDVTFNMRIVLDDDGYVSSVKISADEDAIREYGTVFETIAKRICSELRADRPSHGGCSRRFEGIHLTIGRR